MKIKYILLILFMLPAFGHIEAQKKKENTPENKVERFKERLAGFLKEELQLTEAEATAFIPLVNELMDKKYEANRRSRMYIKKMCEQENKTDADYKTAIEGLLNAQAKEVELQKEYYQKFMQVLPAEKVYRYHSAESKFMRRALEKKEKQHDKSPR